METAVEACKGKGSLEFEGGKSQLEVEAGDGREGDTKGGGQGLIEFDLQLGSVGGGVKDHGARLRLGANTSCSQKSAPRFFCPGKTCKQLALIAENRA